ncbi:hypothetical protein BH11ARM2_BH11ARM2_10030 [soil metagenome]
MVKALLDTSTYIDIRRLEKSRRMPWARNTLRQAVEYRNHPGLFTLSSLTVFKLLEGLHRGRVPEAAARFSAEVLPDYEVLYPNKQITFLVAEINAALENARQSIGIADVFIAATAISEELTLVNANTKHLARVQETGFPLRLDNWRDQAPSASPL